MSFRAFRNPAALGLAVLLAPVPALSQSCALCYTQAAAATAQFIQALRSGILILVIPPMCLSVAVIVLAYRRRHAFRATDGAGVGFDDESWR